MCTHLLRNRHNGLPALYLAQESGLLLHYLKEGGAFPLPQPEPRWVYSDLSHLWKCLRSEPSLVTWRLGSGITVRSKPTSCSPCTYPWDHSPPHPDMTPSCLLPNLSPPPSDLHVFLQATAEAGFSLCRLVQLHAPAQHCQEETQMCFTVVVLNLLRPRGQFS